MTDFPLSLAEGSIRAEQMGAAALITLDRPTTRNAMTEAMWRALPGLLKDLADDTRVKAVMLTGAGGHFSTGADITEFATTYGSAAAARATNDLIETARAAIANLPKPTIAVVPGLAVGAGCGIAMACDLRFVADAARLALPPARLGAAYPFPGIRQLVGLVGPSRAKDMLYSGRLVGAEEALRIGLVDRVFAANALLEQTLEYVEAVAALSSNSHRIAKNLVDAVATSAEADDKELRDLFESSFVSEDFQEGYRAFLEKRKPVFK
ncbi:MAG: enoyl-CoA hydratase-related protein [Pseudomonadota bacterium]